MSIYIQYGVDALAAGGLFALLALSIALLFNIMGLINFAYGELIMAGGYTMFFLYGEPWPIVVIATIAVCVTLSVLMERLAFRPVRGADITTLLITSLALSLVLQSLALALFGAQPKGLPPLEAINGVWSIGSIQIERIDLLTVVAAAVMLGGMTLLFRRTTIGIQLRASTEDFEMARMSGVNANRVISGAFALTGVLAGVAALLYIFKQGAVTPTSGFAPMLIAFVGAVIGGLGGLVPAVMGGFILGAVTTVLEGALPPEAAVYTQALTFAIVIGLMVFRPRGVGGRDEPGRVV